MQFTRSIEALVYAIAAIFIAGIVVYGVAYMQTQKQLAMSADLKMATERGIDPMAIRCAYADPSDNICLIYTSGKVRGAGGVSIQ